MKVTIFLIVFLAGVSLSHAQNNIPLANNIGEWSTTYRRYLSGHPDSLFVNIRSRVLNFGLTSGEIEIAVVNVSRQEIDLQCGLKACTGTVYDNILNIDEAHRRPGIPPMDSVVFKMRVEGCVLKNPRKMAEMERVRSCQPKLLFITGWTNPH